MQQLSVKAAIKQWGDDAVSAGEKEISQLQWRETFVPKRMSDLTTEQKGKILPSHMFVVKKRDGVTKARIVAGGNQQRGHVTKEDSSSPTVSTESVLFEEPLYLAMWKVYDYTFLLWSDHRETGV